MFGLAISTNYNPVSEDMVCFFNYICLLFGAGHVSDLRRPVSLSQAHVAEPGLV